ncbi:MAG: hypothetical protein RL189_2368, partial [Pseudomonadota bacterium]
MFHNSALRMLPRDRHCARLCVLAAFIFLSLSLSQTALASRLRIVSLAPSVTEWIYALGLGHALVGVTEQCDFPPEATKIEKTGSFMQTSVESVLMKKPTHVVAVDGIPVNLSKRLVEQGIRVHVLSVRRIGDFPEQILKLGEELGARAQAADWADKMRKAFVPQKTNSARAKVHGSALLLVSPKPMYVASPESWLSDLFALAGWKNALVNVRGFTSGGAEFQKISIESALSAGARRWVLFADSRQAEKEVSQSVGQIFPNRKIPAGIELVIFPADVFTRPGPRLLSALATLGEEIK